VIVPSAENIDLFNKGLQILLHEASKAFERTYEGSHILCFTCTGDICGSRTSGANLVRNVCGEGD
jgi:hypothetical protein